MSIKVDDVYFKTHLTMLVLGRFVIQFFVLYVALLVASSTSTFIYLSKASNHCGWYLCFGQFQHLDLLPRHFNEEHIGSFRLLKFDSA